jgi:hypothetical protein
MHQGYSWAPSGGLAKLVGHRTSGKELALRKGVEDDWGKTRPYWCLECGRGFTSPKRVLDHYAVAGHGNETMSIGSRGLTKKQQLEAFRLRNK